MRIKIRQLLLLTAMLCIAILQVNGQKALDANGDYIDALSMEMPGESRMVNCQNNNGYSIITTGTQTKNGHSNPSATLICNTPPAPFVGVASWTGTTATGFVTYTFSPPICAATISYSSVNGPNGSGTDVGRVSIDGGGTMTLNNPCGVSIAGDVLTCTLTGTSNPFGDVNIRVSSTQPFTTITLLNIGDESGWVQGNPCDFIIEDCCTSPDVDAVLVDANGDKKDTFCYLEDVFLDASASSNYDEYFMSVWEKTGPGGATINYARFDPWWKPAPVNPNPFNISDYPNWLNSPNNAETDWMFCPGGYYEIQFALRNRCDGWESIVLPFKVDCCKEYAVEADFELIIPASNGSSYTMEAVNYNTYPDSPEACPVTHSWCVYETDKGGGLTHLATIMGPDFTYTGQDGILYTVVHKVDSPCGEDCYAVEIFRDAEGLRNGEEFSAKSVDCPDDCDPGCLPPTGLECNVKEGEIILSWNDVVGATGYVVEVTYNDPDCCVGTSLPTSIQFSTNDNWLSFVPARKCWSFRVLSICENEKSDWSKKVCGKCSVTRCDAPENLFCLTVDGLLQLNWGAVSGATSYVVEITFDDPDCCKGSQPTAIRYYPEGNSVTIPYPEVKCWSWKVLALCGPGVRSDWSRKICMKEGLQCLSIGGNRNTDNVDQIDQSISLEAYPNPFNDYIYFELSELNATQYLSLSDVLGRTVVEQEVAPLTNRVEMNTGELIPGIYYASLRQADGEVTTIKIVKR